MGTREIKIGKLYHYPEPNLYYVVTAYLPNGFGRIKGPVYETINLERPDVISYAATVTVEEEWVEADDGYEHTERK
jgi:hypothetical protein